MMKLLGYFQFLLNSRVLAVVITNNVSAANSDLFTPSTVPNLPADTNFQHINSSLLASNYEEANTRMELYITMANYHPKRYR